MFSLIFYVPNSHLDQVKESVFTAGAGRIGDYDRCCFELRGRGQYRPMVGANPYQGLVDRVEEVDEVRVEMVCAPEVITEVVQALKAAHPYETPAYHVLRCEPF